MDEYLATLSEQGLVKTVEYLQDNADLLQKFDVGITTIVASMSHLS